MSSFQKTYQVLKTLQVKHQPTLLILNKNQN